MAIAAMPRLDDEDTAALILALPLRGWLPWARQADVAHRYAPMPPPFSAAHAPSSTTSQCHSAQYMRYNR